MKSKYGKQYLRCYDYSCSWYWKIISLDIIRDFGQPAIKLFRKRFRILLVPGARVLSSSGRHLESAIQEDYGFECSILANETEITEDCSLELGIYTNSRVMPSGLETTT